MTAHTPSQPLRRRVLASMAAAAFALAGCATPIGEAAGSIIPGGLSGAPAETGPVRVALLVPSGSGDAERDAIARSLENAARLAIQDNPGANIDLTVLSTGGDQNMAATAASQAASTNAEIIVGPLFSSSVSAVSPIAAQSGIPVLAFSNNTAVAGGGTYVLGTTFESKARRLLSYAAARGLRSTGVIYTQDAEGEAALGAVQSAARNTGTQLVANASYPRSRDGIPAAAEGYTNAMIGAGVDNIVMSDNGTGLVYASSFLPFHGLNLNNVQLIGLQDLSAPALQAERSLEGTWYAIEDPSAAASFASRYSARYGTAPHPLAGLAYDGISAVAALAGSGTRRNAFSAANLTRSAGFSGAEGAFRLRSDGSADRALAIMEVNRSGPQLVDPAAGAGQPGL
ncbi:penicillin-binding protein activator [Roseobacter sp. HKCCA0434]|uniref:penicillin-binding protein activator n=1 Tax=Roseobacter sp. HKCCA0434 TaxID=3079297 RepID=UPI0029057E17|nr:penicillin-binding protein activator [Roseobacter sp. HKCCA0434]